MPLKRFYYNIICCCLCCFLSFFFKSKVCPLHIIYAFFVNRDLIDLSNESNFISYNLYIFIVVFFLLFFATQLWSGYACRIRFRLIYAYIRHFITSINGHLDVLGYVPFSSFSTQSPKDNIIRKHTLFNNFDVLAT